MIRFVSLFVFILPVCWATAISGYVRDSTTGKSIPNANVYIQETGDGIASSPYGYFEINLVEGKYTMETSVIGFKTDIRKIDVGNEILEFEINLESAILEYSEIVVKGLFTSRLGYESVDVINAEEINSMDKESIPDVLRRIPGVDVQFAHPNGRNVNVSIRGSSDYKPGGYNNRVLLLLDGFPIQIPNSGAPDWNSLPLESIKRIEVDNSPASAQYGHNSMGGVINLITDDGSMQNSTMLRFSSGSYSKGLTSITHNNQNGNWRYGINAMAQTSNGHRFNADNQTGRLRTYLRYGDQKGRTYRLSHILSYSDIGHPGFIRSPSYRKSKRLSQYLQGHGFYPLSNGLSMSHSIFINDFNTLYYHRDDSPEGYEDTVQTNYDDIAVGYRSEMLITKFARWIMMIGTDIDWSKSKVSIFNPIYGSPTQLSVGGFFQSKYSIGNGWSLGTGVRYDYRFSNPGSSDPGYNFQKRSYTHWSPKININYISQGKRTFTLAYSEGFRAPSLSELYLEYQTYYGLTHKGNPEVIPERVQSIELTYEHSHSDVWFWGISVFYNRYENMIDFVYNTPVLAINREGVTGAGLEYQFKWKPIEKLILTGSYAYLNMTDRGGNPILYRSKHRGQLNIHYQTNIMNVQLGLQTWSKQVYVDFLDVCHCYPERTLPERLIPELVFSKEISTFTGSIHVTNLFDTQYELIQDYPMPGRIWQVTLTKILN